MTTYPPQPLGLLSGHDSASATWVLVCRHHSGTHVTLVVLGEADVSTADQLRAELLATLTAGPGSVTVDLSGLDFCGLAGLDALHDLQERARTQGVRVTITGMSRQLSWLHRNFPCATTPRSARPLAAPALRPALLPIDPRPLGGAA